MSTEQSESAPGQSPPAVTAPHVETQTAPAGDITQQATTPNATTQRVKNPKRVAVGKMVAERTRLAREEQKKAAEAYHAENKAKAATAASEQAPTTEGESPKSESPKSGLSTNQCSGSITNVKSSKQWPSPRSTNSKRRSPRLSPRVSSQNLLARHSETD